MPADRDRGRLRRGHTALTSVRSFGETKVEHLHDAVGRDLDVRRLEIAVDDAFVVRGLERVGDLPRHRERIVGDRHRAGGCSAIARQRLAFDELEHQRTHPFALFDGRGSSRCAR